MHKLLPFGVAYVIGILSATPASAGFFNEQIEKACPQAAMQKEQLLAKRPNLASCKHHETCTSKRTLAHGTRGSSDQGALWRSH